MSQKGGKVGSRKRKVKGVRGSWIEDSIWDKNRMEEEGKLIMNQVILIRPGLTTDIFFDFFIFNFRQFGKSLIFWNC